MTEQVFIYFISFSHATGKGNVEITLSEHPTHIDTLYTISKSIEEELNFQNVTIDNFILLREETVEANEDSEE